MMLPRMNYHPCHTYEYDTPKRHVRIKTCRNEIHSSLYARNSILQGTFLSFNFSRKCTMYHSGKYANAPGSWKT